MTRAADIQALRELADELSFTIAKAPPKRDPRRDVAALAACIFTMTARGHVARSTCAIRHPDGAALVEMDGRAIDRVTNSLPDDEPVSVFVGGRWHKGIPARVRQLLREHLPREDNPADRRKRTS
jgi:hypothetical protein